MSQPKLGSASTECGPQGTKIDQSLADVDRVQLGRSQPTMLQHRQIRQSWAPRAPNGVRRRGSGPRKKASRRNAIRGRIWQPSALPAHGFREEARLSRSPSASREARDPWNGALAKISAGRTKVRANPSIERSCPEAPLRCEVAERLREGGQRRRNAPHMCAIRQTAGIMQLHETQLSPDERGPHKCHPNGEEPR